MQNIGEVRHGLPYTLRQKKLLLGQVLGNEKGPGVAGNTSWTLPKGIWDTAPINGGSLVRNLRGKQSEVGSSC